MLEFDNGEYESVCIFAEKTDDRGWLDLSGRTRRKGTAGSHE